MAKETKFFGTTEACRITGVDAPKLNESIHNGNYDVDIDLEGRVRVFDERRMVPLWVFGWRLRAGDTPKAAGRFALGIAPIVDALYSDHPKWRGSISKAQRASNILFVSAADGQVEVGFACDRDKFDLGQPAVEYREIDLSVIQAIIREGIAAEEKRAAVPDQALFNLHKTKG